MVDGRKEDGRKSCEVRWILLEICGFEVSRGVSLRVFGVRQVV